MSSTMFGNLNITFDQCLTWNDRIKSVMSKLIVQLRNNNLTAQSANILYTSLIRPVIVYCEIFWSFVR